MKTTMMKPNCAAEFVQPQTDRVNAGIVQWDENGWEAQYNLETWQVGCSSEPPAGKMFVVKRVMPAEVLSDAREADKLFTSEYRKVDAPAQPRSRTLDCPSLFRFEKASSNPKTWTSRETQHIAVCHYCQTIRAAFDICERHQLVAVSLAVGEIDSKERLASVAPLDEDGFFPALKALSA